MAAFAKNEMIGEYTVSYCFYHGSYYESYTASGRTGNKCFIRVILPDMVKPSGLDRDGSVIEGEIASLLSGDPDMGRFLGSGTVEKDGKRLVYIASGWAVETSLCQLAHEGKRLDRHELEQLMQWVLTALDRLHSKSRPVIHNAVEPGNIVIDDGDFRELTLDVLNRARFSDLKPDPDSWHGLDPHFVAPERMEGGGSVRSDIFSAGALMYWLVFGIKPWDSDIDTVLTQDWALGFPEDYPDATVQTVWKEVRSFIRNRKLPLLIPEKRLIDIEDSQLEAMKMALSPEPEERFSSASEFLAALGTDTFAPAPGSAFRPFLKSLEKKNQSAGEKHDEAPETKPEPHRAKGNGFADVAGMEDIKALMREKIIDVLKDPELAEKYRIQIPNGMLLYGPPGCGKSFIAEKFAEEAGWNYKFVKSSDLASTYIHGSQEKIGKLFDEARKNAPMILNFDEFDALVPDRGSTQGAHMAGEVNEFLSQMNSCGKDRVFVIASSNRPDLIDPAVRRKGRLDQMIYIPVPDAAAREGMFRVQMKGRPQEEGIDFGHLASLTENYVAADIAFIVNDAAERAFRSRTDITEKMLEDAIGRTRPSVGPDDIRYYESLRDKIEKSAKESAHNPIGFIQK